MIQTLVDRFNQNKQAIREEFKNEPPGSYSNIVSVLLKHIAVESYEPASLDPERIHKIDDGDYQGTLLFVIAEKGYQPSTYYAVYVGYGSCSGCDSLEAIRGFSEELSEDDLDALMSLTESICRGITLIERD